MQKQKLAGGTSDLAEIIVDYEKEETAIRELPPDSLYNRLKTAWWDWILFSTKPLAVYYIVLLLYSFGINADLNTDLVIILPLIIIIDIATILTMFHLNKKWDYKIKKFFAKRTGKGPKNRIRVTDIKSDMFVIYDTKNVVVDFKATGDVQKQLKKIWIREEHPAAYAINQATLKEIRLDENKNGPMWNIYFLFKQKPKNGELFVEYI